MRYYSDWEEAAQYDHRYRSISEPFRDERGRKVAIKKEKGRDPMVVYNSSPGIELRKASKDEADRYGFRWKRFVE